MTHALDSSNLLLIQIHVHDLSATLAHLVVVRLSHAEEVVKRLWVLLDECSQGGVGRLDLLKQGLDKRRVLLHCLADALHLRRVAKSFELSGIGFRRATKTCRSTKATSRRTASTITLPGCLGSSEEVVSRSVTAGRGSGGGGRAGSSSSRGCAGSRSCSSRCSWRPRFWETDIGDVAAHKVLGSSVGVVETRTKGTHDLLAGESHLDEVVSGSSKTGTPDCKVS